MKIWELELTPGKKYIDNYKTVWEVDTAGLNLWDKDYNFISYVLSLKEILELDFTDEDN